MFVYVCVFVCVFVCAWMYDFNSANGKSRGVGKTSVYHVEQSVSMDAQLEFEGGKLDC